MAKQANLEVFTLSRIDCKGPDRIPGTEGTKGYFHGVLPNM
jgi:hypothetical protein